MSFFFKNKQNEKKNAVLRKNEKIILLEHPHHLKPKMDPFNCQVLGADDGKGGPPGDWRGGVYCNTAVRKQ